MNDNNRLRICVRRVYTHYHHNGACTVNYNQYLDSPYTWVKFKCTVLNIDNNYNYKYKRNINIAAIKIVILLMILPCHPDVTLKPNQVVTYWNRNCVALEIHIVATENCKEI